MDERELSLQVVRTLKTLLQKLRKAGNAVMRVKAEKHEMDSGGNYKED